MKSMKTKRRTKIRPTHDKPIPADRVMVCLFNDLQSTWADFRAGHRRKKTVREIEEMAFGFLADY